METFSALLAICAGNSPVTGEFRTQRPVTRSFDIFFDLRLNKRLSKQSWGKWFETPVYPLWRHCNDSFNRITWFKMARRHTANSHQCQLIVVWWWCIASILIVSSLVIKIKACRLFGAKPLPEPVQIIVRGTHFSESSFRIQLYIFNKMQSMMSSANCRLFCLGLNILKWI